MVKQGALHVASGTPCDLSEYLALTLQAGLCRIRPNISVACRGMKINSRNLNENMNSRVGEAGAGVDAELGLQRSSTNPPLQPAPTESQMPTVAAGPGISGSDTNVVSRQIAIKEYGNHQATAVASSDKKRLTGFQKRKLRLVQTRLQTDPKTGRAQRLVSMGRIATRASWSRWDHTPQFFTPKLRPYSSAHAKHGIMTTLGTSASAQIERASRH